MGLDEPMPGSSKTTTGTTTGAIGKDAEDEASSYVAFLSKGLSSYLQSPNGDSLHKEKTETTANEDELWDQALIDLKSDTEEDSNLGDFGEMDVDDECSNVSQEDFFQSLEAKEFLQSTEVLSDVSGGRNSLEEEIIQMEMKMNPENTKRILSEAAPSTRNNANTNGVRNYQTDLCEMAKGRNIIACLPTGSGKTLIALKLMNSYKHEVSKGKRIFFLAPTIPLIRQQTKTIEKCTGYKVQIVIGDTKNKWVNWKETFQNYEVFVAIPSLFLYLVDHGFLSLKDIALIVIDECHHVLKANSINLVMKRYKEMYDAGISDVPRILGLTATIIKQNLNKRTVEDAIQQVESRLCCKAVTYDKFEQVLKHSTKAEVFLESYKPTNSENVANFMARLRNSMELCKQCVSRIGSSIERGGDIMEQLSIMKQHHSKYNDIINCTVDLEEIVAGVGIFGAMIVANIRYQHFQEGCFNLVPRPIFHNFITALATTMFAAHNTVIRIETEEEFVQTLTPKMKTLLRILQGYNSDLKELCGIIFVQKRTEAHAVGSVLEHLNSKFPERWGFIKPSVVLGTNKVNSDPPKYRHSERKQAEVLHEFKEGLINLLVSTDILQEGIDVQSCSLIVRFDKIRTYPSFVQSMGRARREGAKFFVLVAEKEIPDVQSSLSIYTDIKYKINETVMKQADSVKSLLLHPPKNLNSDVLMDLDDLNLKILSKYCFRPGNDPEGPIITLFSSVQIVQMFCQLLPRNLTLCPKEGDNKFSNLRGPLSIVKRIDGNNEAYDNENDIFQGLVRLPRNSVVNKDIITGPVIRGKDNAKRAAHLEVCKLLYHAGMLNENLLPCQSKILKAHAHRV